MRNTQEYIKNAKAITRGNTSCDITTDEIQAIKESVEGSSTSIVWDLIVNSWRFGFECGRQYKSKKTAP